MADTPSAFASHGLASACATVIAAAVIGAGAASAQSPPPCVPVPDHASALRARPGNLVRENTAARRQKLSSLPTLGVVKRFTRAGLLVPVPPKTKAYVVARIRPELRVARPWTKRFIDQLGHAFHASFKTPLKITSLTRTAGMQRTLRRWNGNAAPSHGQVRSTHLTGAAVDISKRPLGVPHVRRAALFGPPCREGRGALRAR